MLTFLSCSIIEISSPVANQYYESEVISEYVIKGNAAIIKCNIPSFVTDFARVEGWIGSDNQTYEYNENEAEYGLHFPKM